MKKNPGFLAAMILTALLFVLGFAMVVVLMLKVNQMNAATSEEEIGQYWKPQSEADKTAADDLAEHARPENTTKRYIANEVHIWGQYHIVGHFTRLLVIISTILCLCIFIGFTFLIAMNYYFNASMTRHFEEMIELLGKKDE